jgi:Fic family protein
MLLALHAVVTADTLENPADVGRFRLSDDVRVVDGATNEILFQPPAWATLPDRLARLVDFANSTPADDEWLHPLLKAFVLHFMLAYEHPFVDGNGRVARAMFYWQGLRAGYWLLEYVSISTIIARAPVRYGQSYLFVETDGSDLTYFLSDQARTLSAAVTSLHQYVERRKKEVGALERRLSELQRPGGLQPPSGRAAERVPAQRRPCRLDRWSPRPSRRQLPDRPLRSREIG